MSETQYTACPNCGHKKEFQPNALYQCDKCGTRFQVSRNDPSAKLSSFDNLPTEARLGRSDLNINPWEKRLTFAFLVIAVAFFLGLLRMEKTDERLFSGRFSPDGKYVACGGPGGFILYDVERGKTVYLDRNLYPHPDSFSFAPKGDKLAVGLWNGEIVVMDVHTPDDRIRLKNHSCGVSAVAFTPDGGGLISGSCDRMITFWDVDLNKEVYSIDAHVGYSGVDTLALSGDGRYIASGAVVMDNMDFEIKIWEAATGRLLCHLVNDPYCYVRGISFSPDFRRLLALLSDSRIIAWNIEDMRNPVPIVQCREGICRPVRPPLASDFKEEGAPMNDANLDMVAFSPDGRRLAACGYETLYCWRWSENAAFTAKSLKGINGDIWGVCFVDDNRLLSVGEDGFVRLWDVEKGIVLEKDGGISASVKWYWYVVAIAAIAWWGTWLLVQLSRPRRKLPDNRKDGSGHMVTAAAFYFSVCALVVLHGMTTLDSSFFFNNLGLFPLLGLAGLVLLLILLVLPANRKKKVYYAPLSRWIARLGVAGGMVIVCRFFVMVVASV